MGNANTQPQIGAEAVLCKQWLGFIAKNEQLEVPNTWLPTLDLSYKSLEVAELFEFVSEPYLSMSAMRVGVPEIHEGENRPTLAPTRLES